MSQLLPLVGPAGAAAGGPAATTSLITVQKLKLKDQHLSCEFTEQRTPEAPPRAFALTCAEQVHPDLPHALSRLVPHLCLLTEQLTETPDYWPDEAETLPALFDSFAVTGFVLGKGQGGVTLLGQRVLAGGRVLPLTTPYQSFDDEQTDYPFAGLLEVTLGAVLTEVEAALRGKCTAYRQLDLFEAPPVPASLALVATSPDA